MARKSERGCQMTTKLGSWALYGYEYVLSKMLPKASQAAVLGTIAAIDYFLALDGTPLLMTAKVAL